MKRDEFLEHVHFLQEAIKEAHKGVKAGKGGPFGAVIVKNGKIIARGCNCVTSSNDPTAHAEITAIRAACAKLKNFELKDCIVYASCEPCPMCLGAIYWARPKALYFAADRLRAAASNFDDAVIYREVPLPPGKRTLKTVCIKVPGRNKPFDEWDAKEDKTEY
ncbi:MAG: nucleoside deaminase [Elusimicrobiaceae bacterium]|nr:nucleoside deaminase [Elusimicrobiaceae bacterium]